MTIDEAIKDMQDGYILEIEDYNKICMWLEELKDLRKWKEKEEKVCDKFYQQGRADAEKDFKQTLKQLKGDSDGTAKHI